MAKLVNAIDSKSIVPCGLVGSNPTFGKERRLYERDIRGSGSYGRSRSDIPRISLGIKEDTKVRLKPR